MATWLLKTEPSTYSFGHLQRDGRAVWDGISNNQALIHLRSIRTGDRVLLYHTGNEKQIVGVAEVARGAYPDPKAGDPKLVVVDLVPVRTLPKPISLAAIKKDGRFKNFELVRFGRLSVMPVPPTLEKTLLAWAGA